MLNIYRESEEPKKPTESPCRKAPRFDLRGNKVFSISLGCPRNLVDTEVMLGILLKAGYEPAAELANADFILINTCGFLEASREESLATIGDALRTRKSGAKLIVTGCMVQNHSSTIRERHPEVDYLLGSGDVEGILKAVEADKPGEQITTARSYLEVGEVPRQVSTPPHYAFLKIAEGCRKRCAYCIIPQIKGPLKSKPIERVVREFRLLRKQGAKEIILIAQDLGDWGKDLGHKRSDGLVLLLKELLKEEGAFWLRLLYLYPDEITPELIELMKSDARICPYLDMPIQHCNDIVLKLMHRATSRQQIVESIARLRKEIPSISIRTSLIVGFPGETLEQFEELKQFVREHPIDHVGIFAYSNEPDSHAASLPGHIPQEEKMRRQQELAAVQAEVVAKSSRRFLRRKLTAIVEGYHPDSNLLMRARHAGQSPDIDGQIIINDGRRVKAFGEWYQVEITDIAGYDLIGRVIRPDIGPS